MKKIIFLFIFFCGISIQAQIFSSHEMTYNDGRYFESFRNMSQNERIEKIIREIESLNRGRNCKPGDLILLPRGMFCKLEEGLSSRPYTYMAAKFEKDIIIPFLNTEEKTKELSRAEVIMLELLIYALFLVICFFARITNKDINTVSIETR